MNNKDFATKEYIKRVANNLPFAEEEIEGSINNNELGLSLVFAIVFSILVFLLLVVTK